MGMGVRHRVDQPDTLPEQLDPQLRRRIDQQVPFRQSQDHRAAGPLVLWIRARAGSAIAPDPRHAVGRARPQKDQLAGDVLGAGWLWHNGILTGGK